MLIWISSLEFWLWWHTIGWFNEYAKANETNWKQLKKRLCVSLSIISLGRGIADVINSYVVLMTSNALIVQLHCGVSYRRSYSFKFLGEDFPFERKYLSAACTSISAGVALMSSSRGVLNQSSTSIHDHPDLNIISSLVVLNAFDVIGVVNFALISLVGGTAAINRTMWDDSLVILVLIVQLRFGGSHHQVSFTNCCESDNRNRLLENDA